MAGIAAFVRDWFREPPPTFELRPARARWGQAKPRQARPALRLTASAWCMPMPMR